MVIYRWVGGRSVTQYREARYFGRREPPVISDFAETFPPGPDMEHAVWWFDDKVHCAVVVVLQEAGLLTDE
jgi:hypothetical protein